MWTEASRRLLPESISVHLADGSPGHYSYATMDYEVLEENGEEIRARCVVGDPLYLHEHPDLRVHFQIAGICLPALENAYVNRIVKHNKKEGMMGIEFMMDRGDNG